MTTTLPQVQCPNDKCHRILFNNRETFCPDCGTRLPDAVELQARDPGQANAPAAVVETASFFLRGIAFAIDLLLAGVLTPLLLLPVVGQYICGILWGLYLLLRDMNGASIGKKLCGLQVVSAAGGSATIRQKIMRNIPLVIADIPEFLPFLGVVAAPGLLFVIVA